MSGGVFGDVVPARPNAHQSPTIRLAWKPTVMYSRSRVGERGDPGVKKQSRSQDPHRRAQKAARRKAVLAQRRGPSSSSRSLLSQAQGVASTFGVSYCMVSGGLFDVGIGYVVLGRTISPTKMAMPSP